MNEKDIAAMYLHYNNNYVDRCTEIEQPIDHNEINELFLMDVNFLNKTARAIFLGREISTEDRAKLGVVSQRINDFYGYIKSLK